MKSLLKCFDITIYRGSINMLTDGKIKDEKGCLVRNFLSVEDAVQGVIQKSRTGILPKALKYF